MTDERHQLIKKIFLRASELDGEERKKYLAEAARNDPPLRHEVELLLAHHTGATIIPSAGSRRPRSSDATKSRSRSRLSRTKTAWSRALNLWANHLSAAGQMALGAAVMLIVIFVLAWWSQRYIYISSREYWIGGLQSMLRCDAGQISAWFDSERHAVDAWFADPKFRKLVADVYASPASASAAGPAESAAPPDATSTGDAAGEALLAAIVERSRKDVVVVAWDAEGRTRFGKQDRAKHSVVAANLIVVERVRDGRSAVLPPHHCEPFAGPEWLGAGRALMGVAAPVRDEAGAVIGALFVGAPSMIADFTERLDTVAMPGFGEALAFDKAGRMLNESKHLEQLVAAGIVKTNPPTSVLMPLRDPGGDITQGYKSEIPYSANFPTLAINRAVAGVDGVEVDGYRDYRGVMSIGGWHWIPEHDLGIIVKLDLAAAYNQLNYLRSFFYARIALMILAFGLLLYSWRSAVKLRRQVADTPRIGPYVLDVPIGEGGMGRVYRAHHALLKRPTAVKIIKPELVSEQTSSWFEREVTLASRLSHPNTIEIYDFGTTEEGQFYCAMELLRGLTLSQVLLIEGALPLARAIHILKQAAASLAEAHEMGLMHRDIKLHNLMVCFLGGEADFVKVLDFGLAKHADGLSEGKTASTLNIAGTPLYMAPERLKAPYTADARSDVYSLGVVAFKLLTGRDLYAADNDLELFNLALHSPVPSPSSFTKQPLPPELEQLVLRSLSKNPDQRYASASDMVETFDLLAAQNPWRQAEAHAWWVANRQRIRDLSPDWDARNFSGFLRSAGRRGEVRPATK